METQMQLEVTLTGNCIATRVLWSRDNQRVNKDENGKRKLFLYPCCQNGMSRRNSHELK